MKTKNGNVKFILNLALEPKLWFIIFIPVLAIILEQKEFVSSWLSAQIFNILQFIVEGKHDISLLRSAIFFSVLLFCVNIAEWLISTISGLIENYWREHVNVKLQTKFMKKDYRIDIANFDNPELQSRRSAAQGIDPIDQIKKVISGVAKIPVAISFGTVLWNYNPLMVFIAVIVKLPLYFIRTKINNENREFHIQTDVLQREKSYFRNIPVDKSSVKEFKIYHMQEYVCDKYDVSVKKYYKKFKGRFVKNSIVDLFLDYYDSITVIIVQIIFGVSVFKGEMLFGDFTLLIAAFSNLTGSVETLVDFASELKEIRKQDDMLLEYFDTKEIFELGEENNTQIAECFHTITLKKVSFKYPETDKFVLRDLDMEIPAGKICGLVGLNGSGKSTLINLILRLYKPDSGEILLDGINIEKYNIESYYSAIACVFQNTNRYAMPIKEYIAAGRVCDDKKITSVLSQVKLDNWCKEQPHGIDTMLTRAFSSEADSVEPSIGQWQKLSIARAIYKDAPIMILDEPSASLDVDTENEIFNYISKLTVGKTAILVSHRLSNIIGCDLIYMLKDGKIIEQGTHSELLDANGVYADLFRQQAKYYTI